MFGIVNLDLQRVESFLCFADKHEMKSSIFPSFGIAERLTLVATAIVVLSLVGVGGLFVNGLQNQMKYRVESEAKASILIAQKTLAQPMWYFDKAAIASTSLGLIQSSQGMIRKIRVLGADNSVIYEVDSSIQSKEESDIIFSEAENLFTLNDEITYENKKIGSVELHLTNSHLLGQLKILITRVLVVMAAFIFLASSSLFLLMRKYLAKPMAGLVELAGQIEAGQYEVRDNNWPLEFGAISKAFSRSSEAIKKRDSQLKEYNEKLEVEVQERTQKIDEQRVAMIESSRLASLGEMSAGIAHEINNPLAIIYGRILILQRKLKSHPEFGGFAGEFEKIETMVQRISKIIDGLRAFSRDGSSDDKMNFELNKVITDIVDLCQARLNRYGVTLEIDCPESIVMLHGREVQISQVLINLVNNAADAISALGEKWVRVKIEADHEQVQITVSDSGPGISAEIRNKMMQPFFTTKEIGKGTGLGLSISLGIINDHGGVLVYDDKARTTTFRITLPAVKSSAISA